MLRDLLDWWDGVELWLTQLSFPFQVLLAVLVLLLSASLRRPVSPPRAPRAPMAA